MRTHTRNDDLDLLNNDSCVCTPTYWLGCHDLTGPNSHWRLSILQEMKKRERIRERRLSRIEKVKNAIEIVKSWLSFLFKDGGGDGGSDIIDDVTITDNQNQVSSTNNSTSNNGTFCDTIHCEDCNLPIDPTTISTTTTTPPIHLCPSCQSANDFTPASIARSALQSLDPYDSLRLARTIADRDGEVHLSQLLHHVIIAYGMGVEDMMLASVEQFINRLRGFDDGDGTSKSKERTH